MDLDPCSLRISTEKTPVDVPLVIGPISITNAALHHNASIFLTAAKIAEHFQLPYVHTLKSPVSMEELDGSIFKPTTVRWLEVFPFVDECMLRSLVRQAEHCGFSAFVLSFLGPSNHVMSIFNEQPHVRFSDLHRTQGEAIYRSKYMLPPAREAKPVTWFIDQFRCCTEAPVIACVSTTQQDLIFQALYAGVDIICVVIDEYTPFPIFVKLIQMIKQSIFINTPIYAGGSSFTETEVAELIALGVVRIMIDQPIVWGYMIDGFDGICNVVNIYKNRIRNKR